MEFLLTLLTLAVTLEGTIRVVSSSGIWISAIWRRNYSSKFCKNFQFPRQQRSESFTPFPDKICRINLIKPISSGYYTLSRNRLSIVDGRETKMEVSHVTNVIQVLGFLTPILYSAGTLLTSGSVTKLLTTPEYLLNLARWGSKFENVLQVDTITGRCPLFDDTH